MRLAIDARELFIPHGMGRLLLLTIGGLRQYYPEIEISLFLHRDTAKLVHAYGPIQEEQELHFYSCPISLSHMIWENYFLAPNLTPDKFDLFYLPHNDIGVASFKIPIVTLILDVIPLLFPHFYHYVDEKITRIKNAARVSEKIVTISDCSKQDIHRHLRQPLEKIEVINVILGQHFTDKKDTALNKQVVERFVGQPPYIITVGGYDPRKNLIFLLECFNKYLKSTRDNLKLVIVGPNITHHTANPMKMIKEWGIEEQVVFTNLVTDEELTCLYQEAEAFVFPSLYEGFGLPAAEALACGTAVIAATGSSLEEAVDGCALFFDPHDAEELISCIKKIRTDKGSLNEQVEAGNAFVNQFSSERFVRKLYAVFTEVIDNARS